jgi:hypothetical protein
LGIRDSRFIPEYTRDWGSVRLDRANRRSRQKQCTQAGKNIERHGHHLGVQKADERHQRKVRQQAPKSRAGRVDAVEDGNLPAVGARIAPHLMTHEQAQRAAHQNRDRQEQNEGYGNAGYVRGCGEDVPAGGVLRIRRHQRRNSTEMWQEK